MNARRRILAVATAAAIAAGLAGTSATTTVTASATTLPDPGMPPAMVAKYREWYPDVPLPVLYQRLALTYPQNTLLERFVHEHRETFGGSWYDYGTGVWHLLATDDATLAAMADDARAQGLTVATRRVRYSGEALHERATRIQLGKDPMSKVSTKAGVDIQNNRVQLAAPAERRSVQDPMVTYVDPEPERGREQACIDRNNCGYPLRSGIILWHQAPPDPDDPTPEPNPDPNDPERRFRSCSLGWVARGTDGSTWALTAGHCANFQDEVWGHGGQYLGRMRQCGHQAAEYPCIRTADVDAARIHITNPYWSMGSYGHIFSTPSSYVDVDNAITSKLQIQPNQAVCLSAWHSSYIGNSFPEHDDMDHYHEESPDVCGRIKSVADPAHESKPSVVGASVCPGDSGGAWYMMAGGGERWAMGMHNGGEHSPGSPQEGFCTEMDELVDEAWFTSLPAYYIFTDPLTSPTRIRVITR